MKFDPNDTPPILDTLDELISDIDGERTAYAADEARMAREQACTLLSEAFECYRTLRNLASAVHAYLQDADKDNLKRELSLAREHLIELENS